MSAGRVLGFLAGIVLVAATLVPALAAAPASSVVNIKLTFDLAAETEAWVASGPGVCRSGTTTAASISYIEFEPFKIVMDKELTCDDGSGSFLIRLSSGQVANPTSTGGWIVTGGSGAYENAVGGGSFSSCRGSPRDQVGFEMMHGVIIR
jgi:hypothetical protein